MPHFFVSPKSIRAGRFVLSVEESGHLARVLRKKAGEEIGLFDGVNHAYRGVLEVVTPERVEGKILAEVSTVEAPYLLRLFQAIPKGDAFEWILEKATELGVAEIVPLQTRRSVAVVPADRWGGKRERWEKIVRAASAQCGRAEVPHVSTPVEVVGALARFGPGETSLIPWEGETERTLKAALASVDRVGRRPVVNVMIGPEGGFDPGEVAQVRAAGVVPVTLGPRILRTETAGIFAASAIFYELGL